MPEWLMGTDCKSVGSDLRWFKSSSAQKIEKIVCDYSIRSHYPIGFSFARDRSCAYKRYKKKDNNQEVFLCFLYYLKVPRIF